MKNKFKYLIAALCIPIVFLSQTSGNKQTLKQIKADKEAYFDNQRKQKGEEYLAEEGSEYNEYIRWLRLWELRIGPDETVEDYVKRVSSPDYTAKARTATATPSVSDPWTELGPTDQPATGLSIIGGGDRGVGPTQYIAFYKPNPSIMLVSSLAGGLFYSTNKGATWAAAGSDTWTFSGCTSMDFSPTNPNTWYGCSNLGGDNNRHKAESGFAIGPGGVWRTTNTGSSYTLIGDQYDFNDPGSAAGTGSLTTIHKILIDPNNELVGYVATTGGLYKSINMTAANPTWYHINSGNVEDIEFKTDNSNVIFITRQQTYDATVGPGWNQTNDWVMEVSTTWGGLTVSGGTWTNIAPPSGGFIANQSVYVAPSVGISERAEPGNMEMTTTQADPNMIYLEDVKYLGPNAIIYTFDYNAFLTLTLHWNLRRTLTDLNYGMGRALGVSNVNSSIVYIGHNNPGYVYKSTNYGAGDVLLNTGLSTINYHVDIENIVPPPYCVSCSNSTDVFINTHGGVSYSSDACANISSRSTGLGVAEISGFSETDQDENTLIMGLDHDGTLLTGNAESYPLVSWETVLGGDGAIPFVDKTILTNFFAGTTVTAYEFSTTGGHDGTYGYSSPLSSATLNQDIVQNKVLSNYMYYRKTPTGSFNQIYRSNDHGVSNSVQITNFGSPYVSTSVQEIACSPSDPNYMYIDVSIPGVVGGHAIFRNTNVNAAAATVQSSWVALCTPGSNGMGPSAVDQFNPNIIYMSIYGSRIYKCDYTTSPCPTSFVDLTFNLPWINFPSELLQEKGSTGLYLAAGTELWYTNKKKIDNFASDPNVWEKLSALPNVTIPNADINYTINKIRAGTSGRGIWERNLICPADATISFNSVAVAPNFYEANYITFTNATLSSGGTKVFRGTNSVIFNPGFIAQPSTTNEYCLAFIHGCSTSGNSFKDNPTIETDIIESKFKMSDETSDVLVYPNPNNGSFMINTFTEEEKDIIIYDVMGKIVFEKYNTSNQLIAIDITNQAKGAYLIKIISNKGAVLKKVVNQ